MTVELVEKDYCKAYDVVAKMCRCGNEHGSRSTYCNHACRCEACRQHEAERKRLYRQANRERERQRKRAYREANPEKIQEQSRAYYRANREKVLEYGRAYRKANPERMAEMGRTYRIANPDKKAAQEQRRRARQRSAPGNLHDTATYSFWWNGLLDLYDRCPVCERDFDGENVKPTLEHIVAIANGGEHDTSNATILCHPCNASKNTKDMDTWLVERRKALGLPPLD